MTFRVDKCEVVHIVGKKYITPTHGRVLNEQPQTGPGYHCPAQRCGQGPGQGGAEDIPMPSDTLCGTAPSLRAVSVTPRPKDTDKRGRKAQVGMCLK